MNKILILLFFAATVIFSQEGSHFRIYADIEKQPFFKEILAETRLDDVFLRKFQMVVNVYPADDAFVVIGRFESPDVEWDREAYRYDWLFFSPKVREKILKYNHKIFIK